MVLQFFLKSKKNGFSLLELLVVISLIGILSISGLASYVSSQKSARDGRRKTDLETIRQALELYRADNNGQYPNEPITASCDSSIGFTTSGGCAVATGGDWSSSGGLKLGLVPNYLIKLPVDPINEFSGIYSYSNYYLYDVICDYDSNLYCGGENQVTPSYFDCTGKGCCAYQLSTGLESTRKGYSICGL